MADQRLANSGTQTEEQIDHTGWQFYDDDEEERSCCYLRIFPRASKKIGISSLRRFVDFLPGGRRLISLAFRNLTTERNARRQTIN